MGSKKSLLDKMYMAVVGCNNCPPGKGLDINATCKLETLQRHAMQYQLRHTWMKKVYRTFIDCRVYDKGCIERKIRDSPVESFQLAYEIMRLVVGCDHRCNINDSIPDLRIPGALKYLFLPEVAGMAQTCDTTEITGGGLHKATQFEHMIKTEKEKALKILKAKGLRREESNVRHADEKKKIDQQEKRKMAERSEMFTKLLSVEQAKFMYKMIHHVLSLPEPEIQSLDAWRFGGYRIKSAEQCTDSKMELQPRGCEYNIRKHQ